MYSVFTIISQWNEKCEYMRLTSLQEFYSIFYTQSDWELQKLPD